MNTLKDDNYDPRLVAMLDELKPVLPRDPQIAVRAKASFLAEAVSVREAQRHSIWIFFQQKEKLAMKLAMSALVILVLLFGGNATVAAAQDDLPYEPLYQIKLLSEDVNLWLTSDPMAQIEMLMQQTETRTEEMAALTIKGITPPPDFTLQVQERIQRALQLTSNLDEPSQIVVREQIHERLQRQEQMMSQLQAGTCPACEPILQRTREMLRNQLREMDGNTGEAGATPNQTQNQIQNQIQNQTDTTQTLQPVDHVVTPNGTACTPAADGTGQQNGNGDNNPSDGTSMPQHDTTNQDGSGQQDGENNGSGEQNGDGQGSGGGSIPGSGGQGGGGKP